MLRFHKSKKNTGLSFLQCLFYNVLRDAVTIFILCLSFSLFLLLLKAEVKIVYLFLATFFVFNLSNKLFQKIPRKCRDMKPLINKMRVKLKRTFYSHNFSDTLRSTGWMQRAGNFQKHSFTDVPQNRHS